MMGVASVPVRILFAFLQRKPVKCEQKCILKKSALFPITTLKLSDETSFFKNFLLLLRDLVIMEQWLFDSGSDSFGGQ